MPISHHPFASTTTRLDWQTRSEYPPRRSHDLADRLRSSWTGFGTIQNVKLATMQIGSVNTLSTRRDPRYFLIYLKKNVNDVEYKLKNYNCIAFWNVLLNWFTYDIILNGNTLLLNLSIKVDRYVWNLGLSKMYM